MDTVNRTGMPREHWPKGLPCFRHPLADCLILTATGQIAARRRVMDTGNVIGMPLKRLANEHALSVSYWRTVGPSAIAIHGLVGW